MNSYHSKFKNEYNKHSKTDSNYSISLNQLDQPLDVSNNMNVYDESHVLYYEIFNHILNSHAEAAILKEIHEEMFDIYVEKMKHISNSTAKSYCKIISKFMLYSPSIDPHDLGKFIQYEFNLKSIEDAKFTKLKGTPLKYHN